jgi:hydrogenase nickel incorporation protein HypB
MHKVTGIPLGVDILEVNRQIAKDLQKKLAKHGVKAYDFMGSIGSGKTLLIEQMLDILGKKNKKCGVIAGDVAGDDDYKRFKKHGVKAVNVNTGVECHLDAHLVEHAIEKFDLDKIDILFIENVGNLVCPADFPLGSRKRAVVISVTEGDDMVRKHPVIFGISDVIVINKIDLAKAMEVDPLVLVRDAMKINPHSRIVFTDARRATGVPKLMKFLGI